MMLKNNFLKNAQHCQETTLLSGPILFRNEMEPRQLFGQVSRHILAHIVFQIFIRNNNLKYILKNGKKK